MRNEYLQDIRYKLQKRVRRLNGADSDQFIPLLRLFWVFVERTPILTSIVRVVISRYPKYKEAVKQIGQGTLLFGDTEEEAAAIGYGILKSFSSQNDPNNLYEFLPNYAPTKIEEMLENFRSLYLDPFYEYVDEQLDDPRFVLNSLVRFKHCCEWFWRQELYSIWESDVQRGEKNLARKLYEYLYREGIEFSIEPSSASGEADLVSSQRSDEPLVADAKIFNPEKSKSKSYLISGFRQIYQYTCDYNEPLGYLAIFNTSDKELRFAVGASAEPIPRIVVNNKTIFFVVIDIYPHETSASKRPKPEVIEISEQDIIGAATSDEPAQPEPATP